MAMSPPVQGLGDQMSAPRGSLLGRAGTRDGRGMKLDPMFCPHERLSEAAGTQTAASAICLFCDSRILPPA